MATIGAKAEMDKAATARLDKAVATLSKRFGIERPEHRRVPQDAHLEAIYGREDMATLLEGLVKATSAPAKTDTETEAKAPPREAPATGGIVKNPGLSGVGSDKGPEKVVTPSVPCRNVRDISEPVVQKDATPK